MKIHSWLTGFFSLFFLITLNAFTFAAQSSQPADVRILVDISGSMKQTDPNNLRLPAVNLLIEMLPDNSQAGIWTFGRYVNMLVPPATVNKQWRDNAKSKAQQNINSLGLFTNLTGVLNNASHQVESDSGFSHSIILLTDGHIDMREPGMPASTDELERQKLMQVVLPKYVAAGAKIHTVALSDEVDKELLQQLSAATDGLYLEAHQSNDLLPIFLKAFDRAVATDQVPLINNQFQIDTGIKEFTALIFNQDNQPNTRLVAPNGKAYTEANASKDNTVRWFKDRGYELITINNPAPGLWHTEAKEDPSNRIQVLTDLKLKVTGIPATIFPNQEFKMLTVLLNQEENVTSPEILSNSKVTLTVTAPSGRVGSKLISSAESIPEDGFFEESFGRLNEEGEYHFKITLKSPTFERQRDLSSTLLKPVLIRQEKIIKEEKWLIAISPNDNVDTSLTRIHASVTAPNGKTDMHELIFNDETRYWSLYITETNGPGEYNLKLSGRVVLKGGASHNFNPESMQAYFPLAMAAQSPSLQNQAASKSMGQQQEKISLDLASEFEHQQNTEEAQEEPETVVDSVLEELAKESDEEKSKLWLYISLAVAGAVVLIATITTVIVKKKRKAKAALVLARVNDEKLKEDEATERSKEEVDDLGQHEGSGETSEATDELEFGEFDDFDGEEEVEIPGASDENDSDANLDDDFALDPPTDKSP